MSKKGVLLVNLGSPDSPSVPDVRRYLREFLMDGRVLDAPWPIRFMIVHGIILPFRPKQSAEAYETIWQPEGSPLVITSRKAQSLLQQRINIPVELGMRYQNPTIQSALASLVQQGVTDCHLIPLFPHFAMSSFETAVERVRELATQSHPSLQLTVQDAYYNRPDYIAALAATAKPYLDQDYDHLLFSFHGIPERHLRKSDPTKSHCLKVQDCCNTPSSAHQTCYRAQCFATVRAFTEYTQAKKTSVAFQSRLGRDPWLTPYTDKEIERLAKSGVRKILVMCPAFVSDCLETIEEIGIRAKETFVEAGGQEFDMIPCLNDHPDWIKTLQNMVLEFAPNAAAATA